MINQLVNNIKKLDAPIVVGLEPMLDYVPEYIKKAAFAEYGETLEGAAEAIWQYNKGIIDATYDLIPAVKPQIAMYEQFGVPGLVAFNKTCEYAKSKGLVIIGDIKRGDIGSTSKAYAIGHVGKVAVGSKTYSGFCEDFVTVNPYLGSDGIPVSYTHLDVYKRQSYLLTPATVCLAVPLYEQLELLKKNKVAVVCGILSGTLASLTGIFVLCMLFGFNHKQYVTMLPKSITTAIGIGISEELGGIVTITVAVIIITGILGNVIADTVFHLSLIHI